jgi:hypothetical protein
MIATLLRSRIGLKVRGEVVMPGVERFFEVDAFGRRTGRQLLLKPGVVMPKAAHDSSWSPDGKFSPADELMNSSGFKAVLEAALKDGFAIVATD